MSEPTKEQVAEIANDLRCIHRDSDDVFIERICITAAQILESISAALEEVGEERKDRARRFVLDGRTPWEWESEAKRLSAALSEAQRDAERIPREPTEAMLEACRMVDNGSDGTIEGQRQRRICNWRAMYDAAIAERVQEGK